MKKITTPEELLKWYNEQYPAIQKNFPKMLSKYESMDRSLLVAECCRLFLAARDAFKDVFLICGVLTAKKKEEIEKMLELLNHEE